MFQYLKNYCQGKFTKSVDDFEIKSIYFSRQQITLPALKEKYLKNYELLAAPLREDFDEAQIENIYKVGIVVVTHITQN